MATAFVDDSLLRHFHALEYRLEQEPEHVRAEIAVGIYLMSPRARPRHGTTQGNVFAELRHRFGRESGGKPPDWLFAVEIELRSERVLSRLSPDVAGWRRSTTGWPDPDVTPVTLIPDWVGEVLSPGTEASDRGPKMEAYGAMGVGWLWLLDCDRRRVETFANVRGRMIAGAAFGAGQAVVGEPFGEEPVPVDDLFA